MRVTACSIAASYASSFDVDRTRYITRSGGPRIIWAEMTSRMTFGAILNMTVGVYSITRPGTRIIRSSGPEITGPGTGTVM